MSNLNDDYYSFLLELDSQHQRELYIKVIALDFDENPIESIEGRVTQGSVPVDGKSSVRRTCSLSLVAQELSINNYLWGLNTKVKILIGLKNNINTKYDNIIWFKMGTFILTTFNINVTNSGYQISLQGKDKMCMLNGDIGGNLTALSYNFDTEEVINKYGNTYKEKIKLETIIREAVHTFGQEPYRNIIINDLEDSGLELLKYMGDSPLYLPMEVNTEEIKSPTIQKTQEYWFNGQKQTIADLENNSNFKFRVLSSLRPSERLNGSIADLGSKVKVLNADGVTPNNDNEYYIIKIETGETCGYRLCDLVYAGELVVKAGSSLTSMLDSIVKMLGNYEYFYNLDGQFVFQKKRTYIKTAWNNLEDNGDEQWANSAAYNEPYDYSFENNMLVSSFQNTPALNAVKNDFAIWGERDGIGGAKIPIHMRYAIDTKPTYYTLASGEYTYTVKTEEEVEKDREAGIKVNESGYKKERCLFGLTEDWWEIRDWAKAWEYSYGKDAIPSKTLNVYSTERVKGSQVCTDGHIISGMHADSLYNHLIFDANGNYLGNHGGSCTHTYEQWLKAFNGVSVRGGYMDQLGNGGYVYFYKPQVPTGANNTEVTNGGQLKIGSQIKYNMDWRELIYQMALDHNKYGNNNTSIKSSLFKVINLTTNKESIINSSGVFEGNSYNSLLTNDNYKVIQIDLETAIRLQNPNFYPTGKTGYEQYYIDIEGFWRQLYNPDYKCSYNPITMNEYDYNTIAKDGEYYYDAPVYSQCTLDDTYFPDIDYYVLNNGKYTSISLTRNLFNANKTLYYYISSTKKEKLPITQDNYNSKNKYFKRTSNSYEEQFGITSSSDLSNLYTRITTIKYYPICEVDSFVYTRSYYIKESDTRYVLAESLGKDEYLNNPFRYYKKVNNGYDYCAKFVDWNKINNGQNVYINDNNNNKIPATTFTGDWTGENYKDKVAQDYLTRKYFYKIETYSYQACKRPSIPYDSNMIYYIISDKEDYDLTDRDLNVDSYDIYGNPIYSAHGKGAAKNSKLYWNKDVFESPESLIFWFDFLDTQGDIFYYSVPNIGDRPKAVNDNNVKGIYFRETPSIIYCSNEEWGQVSGSKSGYAYCQVPDYMDNLFTVSGQGKSAKDVLDEFLYESTACTQSVTITTIPVYHLEPNTRIYVRDDKSHINGEYIIDKINYPLAINGTMSINATKVVDTIY